MNRDDAMQEVERWRPAAESGLGCAVELDDTLTEEFEWGWLFTFVPVDPAKCAWEHQRRRYAVHRFGISTPVGTKGIEDALKYFARHC